MKKLFQFDFDGCMFDSLPPIYLAMRHVFTSCGLTPPSLLTYITELRAPYVDFYRRYGVMIPKEEIHRLFQDKFSNGRERWLFPDVVSQVKRLVDEGHALSIVSGSGGAVISRTLAKAGIHSAFCTIVAGVEHKTDAFRDVAEKSGFSPEDAIVIGDSALDMDYGREAGMRCIGVARYRHIMNGDFEPLKQALIRAGASECIESFHELHA